MYCLKGIQLSKAFQFLAWLMWLKSNGTFFFCTFQHEHTQIYELSTSITDATGDPLVLSAFPLTFSTCIKSIIRTKQLFLSIILSHYLELGFLEFRLRFFGTACYYIITNSLKVRWTTIKYDLNVLIFSVLSGLSTAKRKFADSLNDFKFQCIGDAETDDEMCIGECADVKSNTFGAPEEESL